MTGLDVLKSGWMGLAVLDPRWYANVLFAICVLANFAGRGLRWPPVLGLLLVGACFVVPIHYFPNDHGELVEELGAGVGVWAASLAIVFLCSWVLERPTVPAKRFAPPTGGQAFALLIAALLPAAMLLYRDPQLFPGQAVLAAGCRDAHADILQRLPEQASVLLVD